ncbi:hypothetical protein OTU49_013945, partial [Cherax quadricarinatus]
QEIVTGGRYEVKTEEGITSLTIHDVVQADCDKYTIVVRNIHAAHAAFASLAVGSAIQHHTLRGAWRKTANTSFVCEPRMCMGCQSPRSPPLQSPLVTLLMRKSLSLKIMKLHLHR